MEESGNKLASSIDEPDGTDRAKDGAGVPAQRLSKAELFARLPDHAREEILAMRASQVRYEQRMQEGIQRAKIRVLVEATMLVVFTETALTYASLGRTLAALVVGPLLGMAWYATGAGRFRYIAIGLVAHLGMRRAFGFGDPFTAMFGALAFIVLAAALGMMREGRRAGSGG